MNLKHAAAAALELAHGLPERVAREAVDDLEEATLTKLAELPGFIRSQCTALLQEAADLRRGAGVPASETQALPVPAASVLASAADEAQAGVAGGE